LPAWRRLLTRLNWHPIIDAQINAIEREEAQIAADLLSRACLRERYCCAEGFAYSKGRRQSLILHADNGNAVAAGFREAIAGSHAGKPAGGAGVAQILL
jgi:hypothetical protein